MIYPPEHAHTTSAIKKLRLKQVHVIDNDFCRCAGLMCSSSFRPRTHTCSAPPPAPYSGFFTQKQGGLPPLRRWTRGVGAESSVMIRGVSSGTGGGRTIAAIIEGRLSMLF